MTFTEIQPMLALALGAIGTSLGLINFGRDIYKNREDVKVLAIPVLRTRINSESVKIVGFVESQLEINSSENTWRNIGMRTPESVRSHLASTEIPNLVGFEVRNNSGHSVFLYSLGLADKENKNIYQGAIFDAIQSLKAERVEGDPIEIKSKSLFTTYLYLDSLAIDQIENGKFYPVVETTSRNKRVNGKKEALEVFSQWIKHQRENSES